MKYFVIGGAGFIGNELVRTLLSKIGNHVTVYDDLSSGKLKYINNFKNKKNFDFIKGNILNQKHLTKSIKGHDFVFHLAANPDIRVGLKETRTDFEINTIGTLNVLDAMIDQEVNKIAFTSTSTVFGTPTKIPTPETYGPPLAESFYGASKLACEGYISAYSNMHNIKSWIFRLANITGYPATHGVIYDFYKKIEKNPKKLEVLGDGNQKKSYITNDMLADAMFLVIKKTINKKGKVWLYNVGNEDNISVREITNLFLNLNHIEPQVEYAGEKVGWKGDVPFMKLDIKKIKQLGWKPKKNSEQCIIESIKKNRLRH